MSATELDVVRTLTDGDSVVISRLGTRGHESWFRFASAETETVVSVVRLDGTTLELLDERTTRWIGEPTGAEATRRAELLADSHSSQGARYSDE